MRAWFVDDDGRLREVTDISSIGRGGDRFLVWRHGYEVFSAPQLLRASAFDGCRATVWFRADRLQDAKARYDQESFVRFTARRMTVSDVTAVEVVADSYPPEFERLCEGTDGTLCLRVRGFGDLLVDAQLVSITASP